MAVLPSGPGRQHRYDWSSRQVLAHYYRVHPGRLVVAAAHADLLESAPQVQAAGPRVVLADLEEDLGAAALDGRVDQRAEQRGADASTPVLLGNRDGQHVGLGTAGNEHQSGVPGHDAP